MNNRTITSLSMFDFGTQLRIPEYAHLYTVNSNEFYMGNIGTTPEDGITLLFLIPEVRNLLRTTKCFLLDGSFDIGFLPSFNNECQQLYVLMGMTLNTGFPIAFAVMSRKTEGAYIALFQKIKMLEPAWEPDVLIVDFELASTSALNAIFPHAEIHGCWFNYCQAIWRKVKNLRMMDLCREKQEAHNIVKMLMALPLLPVNELIKEGFEAIRCHYSTNIRSLLNENEHDKFSTLFEYYRTTWILGNNAEILPVYGYRYTLPLNYTIWITNYVLEIRHAQLERRITVLILTSNSNSFLQPYTFLDGLIGFANDVLVDYRKTINDRIIRGPLERVRQQHQQEIDFAISHLLDRTYTVLQFLLYVSPFVPNFIILGSIARRLQLIVPQTPEASESVGRPNLFTPEEQQRLLFNLYQSVRNHRRYPRQPPIRRVRQNEIPFNPLITEWCVICRSCLNPNVICMQCMHQGMCEGCLKIYSTVMPPYENMPYYRCPICRSEVTEYLIIQ